MKKLSVHGLAMAFGVMEAAGVFVLGVLNGFFGWGEGIVDITAQIYRGFAPTVEGVFVGMIWGFAAAFVSGAVIAWTYNHFSASE